MTVNNGFRYQIPQHHNVEQPLNRLAQISPMDDPLPLTGWVKGKPASDLEERFARGLEHAGITYKFQAKVLALHSISGQEKVVDFIVERGLRCPVEVDGPIAHQTAAQKGADLVREILLNHTFIRRGIQPIRRVKWWQLQTQQMANRLVREMFGGGK